MDRSVIKALIGLLAVFLLCTGFQFIAGKPPAGGGCDDCSGDLKFAWHFENETNVTTGTPCGCSDGDATPAKEGSPAITPDQKSDGTNSMHVDNTSENYTFTPTNLVDIDNVKITFDLYIVSMPTSGDNAIFQAYDAGPDDTLVITLTTTLLYAVSKGSGTSDNVGITPTATGEWLHIEYQKKVGVDGSDHYLTDGTASDQDDDDPVAITDVPTVFMIGSGGILGYDDGDGVYYVDNFKITLCDKYQ